MLILGPLCIHRFCCSNAEEKAQAHDLDRPLPVHTHYFLVIGSLFTEFVERGVVFLSVCYSRLLVEILRIAAPID